MLVAHLFLSSWTLRTNSPISLSDTFSAFSLLLQLLESIIFDILGSTDDTESL